MPSHAPSDWLFGAPGAKMLANAWPWLAGVGFMVDEQPDRAKRSWMGAQNWYDGRLVEGDKSSDLTESNSMEQGKPGFLSGTLQTRSVRFRAAKKRKGPAPRHAACPLLGSRSPHPCPTLSGRARDREKVDRRWRPCEARRRGAAAEGSGRASREVRSIPIIPRRWRGRTLNWACWGSRV